MKIKFKKILPNAKMPTRGSDGAAGWDVYAAKETIVNALTGPMVIYDTGIALEIPKGYYVDARPRSSISKHSTLMLSNSCGVIDEDYRGSIQFVFRQVNPSFGKKYEVGDRIGQLILTKYETIEFVEADELSNTDRGENGQGSTGLK